MNGTQIALRLNQQQLELLDRTVEELQTGSRDSLIRRALDEYYASRAGSATR
jgi:metal-responsive CopG/Arc/MetJ family transcriptional regulator